MPERAKDRQDDEDEEEKDESSSEDEIDELRRSSKDSTHLWDGFRDIPKKYESGSMSDTKIYDTSVEILKIIAYILTFIMVLGGAVIAKVLMVLMTSQLKTDKYTTACRGEATLAFIIPKEERYIWIWALLLAFTAPELGTFIRSARMLFFKSYLKPEDEDEENPLRERKRNSWGFYHSLTIIISETLHVIGLALFIFEVLPQLDAIKGVMLTNCVCIVPGILSAMSHNHAELNSKKRMFMDVIAVALQLTGFFTWPAIKEDPRSWWIPVSLLFMSCSYWMNYVSEKSPFGFIRFLADIKEHLKETEILLYKTYFYVSVWKVALFFSTALIILKIQGDDVVEFFEGTYDAFNGINITAYELVGGSGEAVRVTIIQTTFTTSSVAVWGILGVQILAAYLCYVFGKFACKILIQEFSFALSSIFVVPVTVVVLAVMTAYRNENGCIYNDFLPNYLFFNTPDFYKPEKFFGVEHAWVWIFWLFSQIWITFHVWFPRCDRRAKTEKLFATPMYSEFLIEQSVCLNRRRDEIEIKEEPDFIENNKIPRIIACATMWHESKPEMLEMLKSILRMDNDQCARRVAKEEMNNSKADQNYYEYETHIFFDDAFELEDTINENIIVNSFVKDFVNSMNKAVRAVHQGDAYKVGHPIKYPTPYGGRLEYILPGKTKLCVHLKDKAKIRHRKRWSQVMYMYYLLGFKLMEETMDAEQKHLKAQNTFLLALDGDIDFKPKAVQLLVDLMRKNDNLGAACGRIHPVGSGFMVWYQLFEYAIGHWLQKATEHMIGCVLCSPGCFSLFRGRALMDDNVMKRYTQKAEEARHYVQYDQGEDRWLCTLLLQRGYRVEYSAASDAFTHCPESFNEFYTQRRRWVPSTMANIMDLLNDYKHTVKINNNISLPYIGYQMMLLAGTILGPGTIFLMLVGAFNAAFAIDNWTAFLYNLIPIVLYILICFFAIEKFQLLAALIISAIYGLIMMAVLVGVLIQIEDDGPLAPSALFLFIVAGEIIVAAFFHPQELFCLPSGAIYYVTIPSMYLLLIIYSVCNLNIVTWGTREVATKKTKAELEEERKEAEEAQKKVKQNSIFSFLDTFSNKSKGEDEGSMEFSLAGLFKCMICTRPKGSEEKVQLLRIADTLGGVNRRLESIEAKVYDRVGAPGSRRRTTIRASLLPDQDITTVEITDESSEDEEQKEEAIEKRNDMQDPYWAEELKKGKLEFLSSKEIKFWDDLIEKYLKPLIEDKTQKAKISQELRELRDQMVLSFFMLNAMFVTVIFLLQLHKDTIYINWPLGAKANITYDQLSKELNISKDYLQLEPIGLVFVLFFAIVLVIQFLAMMFHRFETLSHLLSTTPLTLFGGKKLLSPAQKVNESVKKAKKKLKAANRRESGEADVNLGPVNNRKTIHIIEQNAKVNRASADLEKQFQHAFEEIKKDEEAKEAKKEENRRSSIWVRNRNSLMRNSLSGKPAQNNSPVINSPKRTSRVNGRVSGYNNPGFSAIKEETEARESNELS